MLRRTPCKGAAECKKDIAGDPSKFGEDAEAAKARREAALKKAAAGTPEAAAWSRRGQKSTHFEKVLKDHGITPEPELKGFFIDPRLDGVAGGQQVDCKDVLGGTPAGLKDDDNCVNMPVKNEDKAAEVDKAGPLTADESEVVSKILRIGTHEKQHVKFSANQADDKTAIGPDSTGKGTPDKECDRGQTDGLLSEISAAISEYPVVFTNLAVQPEPQKALDKAERNITFRAGESINGAVTKLKCLCDCARADEMVAKTVTFTTDGWPAPQKDSFLKAMTRMMPNDWPAALRVKT
jgi:hypothetical protein